MSYDRPMGRIDRLTYLWKMAQPPYGDEREWHKDDVADIFHWLKQLVCIVLGIFLGLLGVTGWMGFCLAIIVLWFMAKWGLDLMRIPDMAITAMDLFQDGIVTAMMTFTTLFWLLSFLRVIHTSSGVPCSNPVSLGNTLDKSNDFGGVQTPLPSSHHRLSPYRQGLVDTPYGVEDNRCLSQKNLPMPFTLDILLWCHSLPYVILWGTFSTESSDECREGLAVIPLKSSTLDSPSSTASRREKQMIQAYRGYPPFSSFSGGRRDEGDAEHDAFFSKTIRQVTYHLPHISLTRQDIFDMSLYQRKQDIRVAIATRDGLRIWSGLTCLFYEEMTRDALYGDDASLDEAERGYPFTFEEQVVSLPSHLKEATATAVTFSWPNGTVMALMTNHRGTVLVTFEQTTKKSKQTPQGIITLWRPTHCYDLTPCLSCSVFGSGGSSRLSRQVLAVSECPFRPLLVCLSSGGDVIVIDTQTWRSNQWSLSFSSETKTLPIIVWLPGESNITGFLCATNEMLFQCVLPCGQTLNCSDVHISMIPLRFPPRVLEKLMSHPGQTDSITSSLMLKSFSLDRSTGTRLAVVLCNKQTNVSSVMVFRYLAFQSKEPMTYFEGIISYNPLMGNVASYKPGSTVTPLSVHVGCPMNKENKSDPTWIIVGWEILYQDLSWTLEYRFYTFHDTLVLKQATSK